MKSVIFAPYYTAEEQKNTARLKAYLKENGIDSPVRSLEGELIKALAAGLEGVSEIATVALASDVAAIIDSDCCVGVINGRVPDEAVIIKLGIAYALDVPVAVYKNDSRTGFFTGDNSMILGLSENKPVSDAGKLVKLVKKLSGVKHGDYALPPYIKLLNDLGHAVNKLMDLKPDITLQEIHIELKEHKTLKALRDRSRKSLRTYAELYKSSTVERSSSKVYCSGPLFSPDEHRTMKDISKILEENNYTAYLPERDGAEPYFMGSAGSPLAGSLMAKPFIGLINDMIFSIDVMEIMKCRYFVINLNGRAYDDGAMAELGMAFAMGKPITVFMNDTRTMLRSGIHPVITAVSYGNTVISRYEDIPEAVAASARYTDGLDDAFGAASVPSEELVRTYNKGLSYIKFLNNFKPPKNKMLNWLEGYDE